MFSGGTRVPHTVASFPGDSGLIMLEFSRNGRVVWISHPDFQSSAMFALPARVVNQNSGGRMTRCPHKWAVVMRTALPTF